MHAKGFHSQYFTSWPPCWFWGVLFTIAHFSVFLLLTSSSMFVTFYNWKFLEMELFRKLKKRARAQLQSLCVHALVTQRVRLSATPWIVAHQAPLSMGFSRHKHWSGLPFPSQMIYPTQGSNPGLLHCRRILYRLSHQGSPDKCKLYLRKRK